MRQCFVLMRKNSTTPSFVDYSSDNEKSNEYDTFIRDEILANGQSYEFIYPESRKPFDSDPAYDGFDLSRFGHALY